MRLSIGSLPLPPLYFNESSKSGSNRTKKEKKVPTEEHHPASGLRETKASQRTPKGRIDLETIDLRNSNDLVSPSSSSPISWSSSPRGHDDIIQEFVTPPPSPLDSSTQCRFLEMPSSIRTAQTYPSMTPESTGTSLSALSEQDEIALSSNLDIVPPQSSLWTPKKEPASRPFGKSVKQNNASANKYTTPPNSYPQTKKTKLKKHPSPEGLGSRSLSPSQSSIQVLSPLSNSSDIHATAKSRQQKAKTELCMYYKEGKLCPFGASCTYAHGEHELQTQTLMSLERNGMIDDAATYRCKPCFSHVAMGSCPFGRRCACIHDPRVGGYVHSWLPITETQGNNIMTDINVEGLHQKRCSVILHDNPFVGGPQLKALTNISKNDYSLDDLYGLVCNNRNQDTLQLRKRKNRNRGNSKTQVLSESLKLSIALQLRGETHKWMYKYRPSHVVLGETCMILEKQAFELDIKYGIARKITLSRYRVDNPNHCVVREIAFGPDQDPSVHPIALWFDIPEDQVSECTLTQQKRFRWKKKQRSFTVTEIPSSPFGSRENFEMVRPIDRDAYELVTDILKHRYESLKAESIPSISERSAALGEIADKLVFLNERFHNIKRHWKAWAYPRIYGNPSIDESTPVPPVETEYMVHTQKLPESSCQGNIHHTHSSAIWESFVSTIGFFQNVSPSDVPGFFLNRFCEREEETCKRRRLSIFVRLSCGVPIHTIDRTLPLLRGWTRQAPSSLMSEPHDLYVRQSERCWKGLLLQQDGIMADEWAAVMDHFTNYSRSKKVLNIIQQ